MWELYLVESFLPSMRLSMVASVSVRPGGSCYGLTIGCMDVAVSAVGIFIMAVLFVHELRFYLQTVTVHEV